MNRSEYLLLTPDEHMLQRTYEGDVYLLGSWFSHRQSIALKEKCSALQQITYPFIREEARRAAYYYCEKQAETALQILAPWLNRVHNSTYSLRAWRIQCGFFLACYTQTLYERYRCLQAAYAKNPHFKTWIVAERDYQTPNNYLEFAGLAQGSDFWNLQLFSQIIRFTKWFNPEELNSEAFSHRLAINSGPGLGYPQKWPVRMKRSIISAINRLYPQAPAMLYVGIMPLSGRLRLMAASKFSILQMLPLGRQLALPASLDSTLRSSMPSGDEDEFSVLLMQSLRTNFPKVWLEDFALVQRHAHQYSLKNCTPQLIITDTGWYSNEVFQLWAAQCAEQGSALVGVQHGGGYGDRLINSSEVHERKCADYFISWGWQEGSQVVPLPSLKLEKSRRDGIFPRSKSSSNLKIFMPLTGFYRYTSSFESSQCASQWEEYQEWQFRFIAGLAAQWRKHLVVRLYHWDYGRDVRRKFQQRFPDISVMEPNSHHSFVSCLRDADLFIADNMGTTMLEALARNIPTLMFWKVEDWPSRSHARSLYEDLSAVKVFHQSPEAAAQHVNAILPNIRSWWNDPATQQAVVNYKNTFACTDDRWVQRWTTTLQELIKRQELDCSRLSVPAAKRLES